jgi:hypothetical protein
MEIKNMIQATARVIRITELAKGNIVKVIKTDYSTPELYYGIVVDVLQSESTAVVELLLYKKEYGGVKLESLLLTGNTDKLEIFPAEKSDIVGYFQTIKAEYQRKIEEKQEDLIKAQDMFEKVTHLLEIESDTLSTPKFELLN